MNDVFLILKVVDHNNALVDHDQSIGTVIFSLKRIMSQTGEDEEHYFS